MQKKYILIHYFIIAFLVLFYSFSCPGKAAPTQFEGRMEGKYYVISVTPDQGRKGVQDALNEARDKATVTRPYKIILAPGYYGLKKGLHIYSNTTIFARGATIALNRGVKDNLLKVGGNSTDPVRGYGYRNITIDGGIWNGNRSNAVLFKICHAMDVRVVAATLQNNLNAHLMEVAGTKNLLVYACTFQNQHTTSGYSYYANEAIQLDILQHDHINGYQVIDADMECLNQNITIDQCNFIKCSRGIGAHTSVLGRYFWNIRITNNRMTGLKDLAIGCRNFRNSYIAGNVVSSKGTCLEISNMSDTGNGVFLSRLKKKLRKNVKIPNCNIVVQRNQFTTTGRTTGIRLQGINFSRKHATIINTKNVTARGDTIPKGDYYVNGVNLSNNTIEAKGSNTIRVTFAKNVTIRGNLIKTHARKSGIFCYNGGSLSNTIANNTITGKPERGISVRTYSANRKRMGRTKVGRITGNIIRSARGDAIHVGESRVGSIERNILSGSRCDVGISVVASKVTSIYRNSIRNMGSRGMYLSANSVISKVRSNSINSTRKEGIYITKEAKVRLIRGNTIKSSGSCGISVLSDKKSKVQISSNKITGRHRNAGILVYQGRVNVAKNRISSYKIGIDYREGAKGKQGGNRFKSCGTKVKRFVPKKPEDDKKKDTKKNKK